MKKIKSSLFSRAPKLISSVIKLSQFKDAESVVNNLSELKGMPQKMGQLISMDFSEYLPEEYREKFSKLQANSEKIAVERIIEVLNLDYGLDKFKRINDFQHEPIGTGSIGQVHKATIDNKVVAIKVRYPEIEKTLGADMTLMQPIVAAFELFRPDSKDFSILMKEARGMLIQEMDYQQEAESLKMFKEKLQHDSRYYIPSVLDEFSSEKIVCMEFVDGEILKDFISRESDHARKVIIAKNLLDLFIEEFFTIGTVQTDPNFANYLVKGDNQIVLLDFGATKKFTDDFKSTYFKLLKASYDGDRRNIILFGEKLGLIDRKDNFEAVKMFEDFMIDVASFFHEKNNPMDFSNETITKRLFESGWALWKKQRISRPNSNLVFLHRKLGGLFSLLKESKIKIDLTQVWKNIEIKNK